MTLCMITTKITMLLSFVYEMLVIAIPLKQLKIEAWNLNNVLNLLRDFYNIFIPKGSDAPFDRILPLKHLILQKIKNNFCVFTIETSTHLKGSVYLGQSKWHKGQRSSFKKIRKSIYFSISLLLRFI